MRYLWQALTPRGRALLGGGLLVVAIALAIGERDLMRAGVLATVLPLLSLVSVLRTPTRVTHTRSLEPRRVAVGEQARVRIRLTNVAGRGSTASLRLIDSVPPGVQARPRFTLGRLASGETREVSYRVASPTRGRFPLGPLRLAFVDPLGCVTLERTVGSGTHLLVIPRTVALGPLPTRQDSTDSGANDARFTASPGEDDTIPREYRQGDDLRRVHWPATARQATLMVRSEEHHWLQRSTLLVDTRAGAHTRRGTGSTLELALSVAGSIACRTIADGQRLRLVTSSGTLDAANRADSVLDALAVAEATRAAPTRPSTLLSDISTPDTPAIIAIVGALTKTEVQRLSQRPGSARRRHTAVLLSEAPWPSPEAMRAAQRTLRDAGWRVLVLSELEQLPAAWSAPTSSPFPPDVDTPK
ncbi:DUF58 domain-containing protein [Lipingzhangella sp. LS1_29]|uniref:DUF58 domain-containing protein n=1 Tax=Lipingzhangella rawalii TaxID=2055835 RepID=A0ABU2H3I4_9ACTN|nr:DUF58 domain-containing protein [Lipingzhangella rawalii]MDS1269409.1 DUF58 domain-containing protein [Lipingzhangella rawalii]